MPESTAGGESAGEIPVLTAGGRRCPKAAQAFWHGRGLHKFPHGDECGYWSYLSGTGRGRVRSPRVCTCLSQFCHRFGEECRGLAINRRPLIDPLFNFSLSFCVIWGTRLGSVGVKTMRPGWVDRAIPSRSRPSGNQSTRTREGTSISAPFAWLFVPSRFLVCTADSFGEQGSRETHDYTSIHRSPASVCGGSI